MNASKFLLIVGLSALISACSDDREMVDFLPPSLHCSELSVPISELSQSWQDKAELEVNDSYYLALELGKTLVPEESLYTKIKNDLELIRGLYYYDTATASGVLPCAKLPLLINLDDDNFQKATNGQYTEWDQLNEQFGVSAIEFFNRISFVKLKFERELNAIALRDIYKSHEMEGITAIETGSAFGSGQDICSEHIGDDRFYVFWQGEGDCPAGCIRHKYSGYKIEDENHVTHMGTFEYSRAEGKAPQWFAELKQCPIQLQRSNVAK